MSRIQTIKTQSELEDWWFKFSSTKKILNKLVLLTDVNNPPLFYPILGVQLRKRLTFGMMVVDKRTSIAVEHSSLHLPEPPAYVIFMPDIVYRYGRNIGESEMRDTMANFLLLLSPKEDDVLAFSSIIFLHSILLFIFVHWKPSVYLFLSFSPSGLFMLSHVIQGLLLQFQIFCRIYGGSRHITLVVRFFDSVFNGTWPSLDRLKFYPSLLSLLLG